MPRNPLYRSDIFPYHVTSRTNNRESIQLTPNFSWTLFCEKLNASVEKYRAFVHAFVLMSNHFHLIISTPDANLDHVMRYFLTEVSKAILRSSKKINHVFGGRYRWSVLPNPVSVAYAYKYVLRNPVRANIVDRVEQFPYSTIHSLNLETEQYGISDGFDPLWTHVPQNVVERLEWLNISSRKESEEFITRALKHNQFRFTDSNQFRKKIKCLHSEYGVIPTTSGVFSDRLQLGPPGA